MAPSREPMLDHGELMSREDGQTSSALGAALADRRGHETARWAVAARTPAWKSACIDQSNLAVITDLTRL